MPIHPGDPADVARSVADFLERANIPYALGGALAYNEYGTFRDTSDVDFNIFVSPDQAEPILLSLQREGLSLDVNASVKRAMDGAHVVARAGDLHVDLFFNSIPFHEEAAKRAERRNVLNRPMQVLSAEDIVLLKLLFFRGKDKLDVQRVIQLQGPKLDRAYVRRWLVEMMGEEDERVRTWDYYCRELTGEPSAS